jgi:hypothetical protein
MYDYLVELVGPNWDGHGNISPHDMGFYWGELIGIRCHEIMSGIKDHPWLLKHFKV